MHKGSLAMHILLTAYHMLIMDIVARAAHISYSY